MWQLHSHTRCRESCSAQRVLRALRPPLGGRKPSTIYKTPEDRRGGAPMGIGRSSSRFPECAHGKGLSPIHHHKGHLSFSTWKGNLTSVRAGWEPLHRGPCFPRPGLQDREADRHQDWPRYTRHQVGWNGAPHSLFIIVPCGESHAAQAVLWSCVLGIYVIFSRSVSKGSQTGSGSPTRSTQR